ncbi:hypothetical protein R5R35_008492 [Gryllus longicercus]|uniref:Uncharacterized protein n=1 Tax=Gryllus longicercus TaxID=2509291 RepID=A0AAN9Z0C8_9ORTH
MNWSVANELQHCQMAVIV